MIDLGALARVVTVFARSLVNQYEISDALHDLVDGVTDVLGIAGAGVSLAEGERLKFATAASDRVTALEHVQEGTQAGPCVDAHSSGEAVLVADLADHAVRWPALSRAASEVGMVAVAGIPMRLDGIRLGALNLYHDARRDWPEEEVRVARLLADLATGYVANASRLDKLRHTTEQLQVALESRVVIEQAKGMLANARGISLSQAFESMRRYSRSHSLALRAVAEAVVDGSLLH